MDFKLDGSAELAVLHVCGAQLTSGQATEAERFCSLCARHPQPERQIFTPHEKAQLLHTMPERIFEQINPTNYIAMHFTFSWQLWLRSENKEKLFEIC